MPDFIESLQEEIRAKREKQLSGLRQALQLSFTEYKKKRGTYPKLAVEQDVELYLEARPDLKRAVLNLDLVLPVIAKEALIVLEELQHPSGGESSN